MTCLYAADLEPDEFLSLVERHSWPDGAILMAFTVREARLSSFVYDASLLAETEEGRVFSPDGELKWRRIDQKFRVVYLGAHPGPAGLEDCSLELQGLTSDQRQYFLWGVRTDTQNEWLEQQVPQRFSYPISTGQFGRGRVALVVEEWNDAAGIPRFCRFHSLIEVKGG